MKLFIDSNCEYAKKQCDVMINCLYLDALKIWLSFDTTNY